MPFKAAKKNPLRDEFDGLLADTWEWWTSDGNSGSPFVNLHESVLDDDAYFSYNVGWLHGVSEATGWSLARPTAKTVDGGAAH